MVDVVVITGGGTGLGKAMALTFAGLGARVAIAARRLDVLRKTAAEIEASTGQPESKSTELEVLAVQMDVADPEAVRAMADTVVAKLGLPNIVVNNAAGNFISPTERLSTNAFKAITNIVLSGTAFVTLEFGKRCIAAKQGCTFLSITTGTARNGGPFVVPSATAKAGVEVLTKSLAAEWGRYGMRFNCIAPGPIYTEGAFDRLDPTVEATAGTIPAGRLGEVEELRNLAAFLLFDYASWLNGAIIDFDGGQQRLAAGNTRLGNDLYKLTEKEWDHLEALIRTKSNKPKSKV